MRTWKPYTNATFTHRVDHDAGRHRPARAGTEPARCATCGATYRRRRWTRAAEDDTPRATTTQRSAPRVCPACRRRQNGAPRGYLHLSGAFLRSHYDEIERRLVNEIASASEDNPLGQVMRWDDDRSGDLIIATTTEHLALRLGRALHKTFHGDVQYGFAHENKLAHVWWTRED